jgi:hypothetical protein
MRLFTPPPETVLTLDEVGSIWEVDLLSSAIEGEEAPRHYSRTAQRATIAVRNVRIVKCVQLIVDRDLIPSINVSPCEDSNTTSHCIGVARVIEIAARGKKNDARVKVEFTEMASLIGATRP